MTDAQLLERAQQGDSAAWQSLYERLFPSVWRAAYARLADREAAEDVVSETFLALVRNLQSLETKSCRLYGWVLQVVQNKATDWTRRHNCQSEALLTLFRSGQRRDDNPAVAVLADETRQVVLRVLDNLQDDQRMALEWKYADDLTVREIADRTGRSEKSIESLLHRARVVFRQKYELRTKSSIGPVMIDRNQPS